MTYQLIAGAKRTGSVTSVALDLGATAAAILSVAGSPITTSGTITLSLDSQTANTVLAAPSGSAGEPSFRAITALDITTALTTPPAIGGTTPAAGTFTTLRANSDLTLAGAPGRIKPASNSTTALQLANAAGTSVLNVDTTNSRVGVGTTAPGFPLEISASNGNFITRITNSVSSATVLVADYVGSNVTTGGTVSFSLGQQASNFNRSNLVFTYAGAGSTSNRFGMSFFGTSELLSILASGLVGIGTTSPSVRLHALTEDTNTATVVDIARLTHNVSGALTGANGIGAGITFGIETSTTADTLAGRITVEYTNATHASRTTRGRIYASDASAEREAISWGANGSASIVGFHASTPIAKPTITGSRGGNAALASLLTELANYGLITDSTTA